MSRTPCATRAKSSKLPPDVYYLENHILLRGPDGVVSRASIEKQWGVESAETQDYYIKLSQRSRALTTREHPTYPTVDSSMQDLYRKLPELPMLRPPVQKPISPADRKRKNAVPDIYEGLPQLANEARTGRSQHTAPVTTGYAPYPTPVRSQLFTKADLQIDPLDGSGLAQRFNDVVSLSSSGPERSSRRLARESSSRRRV
ncbi:hypothetical protein PLICRDRAFT_459303 [Plicaturopsis crispa FD-325 SS-3]|nr:hypothetical protein PLICRDRAFT_459303 [Plicaturopsis crispa FD-325 SS-3]